MRMQKREILKVRLRRALPEGLCLLRTPPKETWLAHSNMRAAFHFRVSGIHLGYLGVCSSSYYTFDNTE
jgi:hypothetical protein